VRVSPPTEEEMGFEPGKIQQKCGINMDQADDKPTLNG
jgi:hypothetical protein